MTISTVLTDIEGTTTALDFVHKELFPYSAEHLRAYLYEHQHEKAVKNALDFICSTTLSEQGIKLSPENLDPIIAMLLEWIRIDRKHGALKTLQGLIWEQGYQQKAFVGHVYPDVAPMLSKWHRAGKTLAVYSSGSEQAQRLLFGHSADGDLCKYFSHFFDTRVGGKREVTSYRLIAHLMKQTPENILFLSDVAEELDAAKKAGFQVCQVLREGVVPNLRHRQVKSFADLAEVI